MVSSTAQQLATPEPSGVPGTIHVPSPALPPPPSAMPERANEPHRQVPPMEKGNLFPCLIAPMNLFYLVAFVDLSLECKLV